MNLRFLWRTTIFIITFIFIYLAFPILIIPSSLPAIQAMFTKKISAAISPKNIEISHSSPDSFSLIFTTNDIVTASLSYGSDPQVLSEKIIENTPCSRHRFTANYLQSNTTYFFKININDVIFSADNNHPYQVNTLSSSDLLSDQADTTIYQLKLPQLLSSQIQKLTTLKKLHRQGINKILGNIPH